MNRMEPQSLYSIGFHKTFDVLKTGLWSSFDINPFSFLPSTLINDLTKFALSLPFHERPRISELLLLITSGRLTELNLVHHGMELDPNIFLNVMSKDVCKNLKSFTIPASVRDADIPPLEAVLRSCTSLEEVHSSLLFDLDYLENCSQLRILRFHLPMNHVSDTYLRKMAISANSLKSLEVFAVCTADEVFSSTKCVAKVLLSFPNLISVGLVDTSLPIKFIYKTKSNIPLSFKLKRCSWGISHVRVVNAKQLSTYKKGFSKLIKLAVVTCPYVEELIINVFHQECLQYLCQLQHLTFLSINFNYCDHDYMSAWILALKKIGPQLKHLSVEVSSDVQVNAICENCVNLESLRIRGKAVVTETAAKSNLSRLRRLLLMCMDSTSLVYLLSNCPLLTEMFLDCAVCLDDSLLSNVLKHNKLSELKVAGIHACKLSRLGFRMLFESAVKLEKVSFRSVKFDASDVIHKLNPKIASYPIFNKLKDNEFFRRKLHSCRF